MRKIVHRDFSEFDYENDQPANKYLVGINDLINREELFEVLKKSSREQLKVYACFFELCSHLLELYSDYNEVISEESLRLFAFTHVTDIEKNEIEFDPELFDTVFLGRENNRELVYYQRCLARLLEIFPELYKRTCDENDS